MLFVGDITQLIGKNVSISNLCIDVSVRMTINPIIDVGFGHIITQFYGESTINEAVTKFGSCAFAGRHVVSKNYLIGCLAFVNSLFHKL